MGMWWLASYLVAGVLYSLSDYLWKMVQKAQQTKERVTQFRVEHEEQVARMREQDLNCLAKINVLTPELDKIGGPLSDEEKRIRDDLWREKDDSEVFQRLDARFMMAREISDYKGWISAHQRHYVQYNSDVDLFKNCYYYSSEFFERPRWDLLNALTKTCGWVFIVIRLVFLTVSNFVGDRVWERVLRTVGIRP